MLKNFIDTTDITDLNELEKILVNNVNTSQKIRKEIKKLKELEISEEKIEITKPLIELIEKLELEQIDNNEYLYYYDSIKEADVNLSHNELKQIIKDNLPSKENINYFKIVSRIKAEIYKEIMEYEEISKDEEDILLLKEIKRYVEFYNNKLKLIEEIEKEKIINKEEKKENNIVFLNTSSGNVYALNDLQSIDLEYYDSFVELYDSIKYGTFKNVKRFTSNNQKNKILCEVKGFKTRIIFDRLNSDTYIIIQLLVKKCDNDKAYKETLINRSSIYKDKKEEIIKNITDQEYILSNKNIAHEFEEMLVKRIKRRGN